MERVDLGNLWGVAWEGFTRPGNFKLEEWTLSLTSCFLIEEKSGKKKKSSYTTKYLFGRGGMLSDPEYESKMGLEGWWTGNNMHTWEQAHFLMVGTQAGSSMCRLYCSFLDSLRL